MRELLEAMRDQARQDSSTIGYVTEVEVGYPPLEAFTRAPAIFIVPTGSPTEQLGESGASRAMRCTHKVSIFCVVYIATHDDQHIILGDGMSKGIADFVDDTISFFAGNTLSLAGIDAFDKPTCDAMDNAYAIEMTEDDQFMILAELEYAANTVPFSRG